MVSEPKEGRLFCPRSGIGGQLDTFACPWPLRSEGNTKEEGLLKILHGRCLCGDLRFTIESSPVFPHFCTCTECQRHAGAPVVVWADFPAESIRWQGGAAKMYRSSPGTQRGFCPKCGSTLIAVDDDSDHVSVVLAALDGANDIVPTAHSFEEEAPGWLEVRVRRYCPLHED